MSTQRSSAMLVREVMLPPDKFPVLGERVLFKEALEHMGKSRLGIACVVDEQGKLAGIITDGDVRRKLLKVQKPFSAFFVDDVIDHAIKGPQTTTPDTTLLAAVQKMEERQVWDLPVVDGSGKLVGLLHLHPAIQALLGLKT